MRNKHMLLAIAAATALPALAQADEPVTLDTLLVTGSLTPIAAGKYGRAHTVITAEDIERRQARFVADVLRSVPGVAVSRPGAFGGFTQVRIRGNEGSHTLVLIDGVKANSPEGGEFDFGGLLAVDIERIEILRGPQSALYGSNAIGGVISIVTKRATEAGITGGGNVEAGTDASAAGTAFLRGLYDDVSFSLSLAGQHVGGFDASGDPGGEDDRDRNLTLNSRVEAWLTDTASIGGSLRVTDRSSDLDRFSFGAPDRAGLVVDEDSRLERTEVFASLFAEAELFGGRVASRASTSYLLADDGNFTDGVRTSDTTGDRLTAMLQTTFALDAATVDAANHRLTLAGEYQRETFQNNNAALVFDPSQLDLQSRNLFGVVGEYRGTLFDRLDLQGSIRHDINDDFEDATTFSAGASYRVAETGTRLHGSVGSGVQNPTFFEQFGFIPAQFQGNPNLQPEKSIGWDIGVEQTFFGGRAVVDVTYFQQTLEDEIFTQFSVGSSTPVNEDGESERQGVELQLTVYPLDGLSVGANYSYIDATDFDGGREVRRPRHEGGVTATYSFFDGRASVTADARFVADNLDTDLRSPAFGAQNVKLSNYAVVNLAGNYRFNERVEIYGRIENLTDTDYEEVFGYETQGITGFAGLRMTF